MYTVSVLEGKSNGIERVGGYRVFIIRVLLDDHNLSNVEWATNQANTWTEKVRGREGNN